MENLVIVESPNKIKSLEKYLGENYKVMASIGHITYLPSSGAHGFGVDIETWEPQFKLDPNRRDVVKDLKKAAKKAKNIYLATDPDREGEAIAKHLVIFLDLDNYKRIRFNEITEEAVLNALKNPDEIDEDMVDSQKARRVLDRVIGYKLSNLMRRKIPGAPAIPSAGRVQSIALKLIIEREKLIDAFVPKVYYTIFAVINEKTLPFFYSPTKKENKEWVDEKDIEKIKKSLSNELTLSDIKKTIKKERKITPLKQSSLFKKASSLGLSSSSIQYAAQRLYEGYGEGGLISYPRTDSTRYSNTFISKAHSFIAKKYGEDYIASSIKGSKGAQDAHEAIRPTDLELDPTEAKNKFNLAPGEFKVYKLIYENSLQSLMKVPEKEITRYEFLDGKLHFRLSSSKVIFDGYYKVIGFKKNKNTFNFKLGDKIKLKKYKIEKHQTKPPARYNDGSLIEKLDSIGVGRPSTFAQTVKVLKKRRYIEVKNKAHVPTEFGKIVLEKLITNFKNIINEKYTAEMEKELDLIADGKMPFQELLDNFWGKFENEIQSATQEMEVTKVFSVKANKKCPECNNELMVRINKRYGTKFLGCSNFPKCKYTAPYNEDEKK